MLGRLALVVLTAQAALFAQTAQVPETPRQALTEMLFSGSPTGFAKHLPNATKAALLDSGSLGMFGSPDFSGALKNPSKNFESFPAGPILISSEDKRTGEKTEINIDRDDLMGDRDEIDLSFHTFKNGQEQSLTPFFPKLTLVMGLEGTVWKLKEVGMNLRIPLDDPQFLKAMKENFAQAASAQADTAPISNLQMLLFAEQRYKNAHPDRGYTCSLSDLAKTHYGSGDESTPLLDAALATGTKDNYTFALSGCGSVPSSTFQITALPAQGGHRAYCVDESRAVTFATDGQAATCLASGTALQPQTATGAGTIVTSPAKVQ
jgi:hypothetical protein